MENPFVRKPEEYTRDLNLVKHYVSDASFYLHKRTGRPLEECKDWVENKIHSDSPLGIKNPRTLVLTRVRDDLKIKEVTTFNEYLQEIETNERIISPTLTVYKNQKQKKSILSLFIRRNIDDRGIQKAAKFIAKQNGDYELADTKGNEEKGSKLSNNSLSGAHASTSTVLRNKSAHSSLTSTCRSLTSYANANNEKFLAGNRHYWSPEITLNNIVSITNTVDYKAIKTAMALFDIKVPTPEFIMELIRESTFRYWSNRNEMSKIEMLVNTLSPLERVAFTYVGDMYSLAQLNPGLVKEFLGRLSVKKTDTIENPEYYVEEASADVRVLAQLLCSKETSGRTLKKLKAQFPQDYNTLGATIKNIVDTTEDYKDLIVAFWRTSSIPSSVANIKSIIRKTVLTSDTDSTIFTTQYWTEWYTGKLDFSEESININHVVTFLASQTIIHILATISAGMGVQKSDIHSLAMKNEYYFPVFSLTSMAKHYFAGILACEGVVYDEIEMEIKGVYLKDSNIPKEIMEGFNALLKELVLKTMRGEKISVVAVKNIVKELENSVKEKILEGDPEVLTTVQIKEEGAYVKPLSSAYAHYDLWESVFADKYGNAPNPPYGGIKVNLALKNKTAIREWLISLEDTVIAGRLQEWFDKTGRTSFNNIILPKEVVSTKGIPPEIACVLDIKKMAYSVSKPYYLLLEALSLYMVNDKLTRLVSD